MPRTRSKQAKVTETYNKKKGRKPNTKVVVDLTEDDKKIEPKRRRTNLSEDNINDVKSKIAQKVVDKEDLDQIESFLIKFDLDLFLGPCRGITRTERLERAMRFHIDADCLYNVQQILNAHCDDPNFNICIWDKRHY